MCDKGIKLTKIKISMDEFLKRIIGQGKEVKVTELPISAEDFMSSLTPSSDNKPNEETLKVFKETELGENLTSHLSVEDLFLGVDVQEGEEACVSEDKVYSHVSTLDVSDCVCDKQFLHMVYDNGLAHINCVCGVSGPFNDITPFIKDGVLSGHNKDLADVSTIQVWNKFIGGVGSFRKSATVVVENSDVIDHARDFISEKKYGFQEANEFARALVAVSNAVVSGIKGRSL